MIETCSRVLREAYGLPVQRVEEVRGGWSARAFRADTAEAAYFLKVYDRALPSTAPWVARIGDYLPPLYYLSQSTPLRGRVPTPVLTAEGAYQHADERFVYVLFDFIQGHTVGFGHVTSAHARELAEAVAVLHGYGADMPGVTDRLQEAAEDLSCQELAAMLREGMPEALAPAEDFLAQAVSRTEHLRRTVRRPVEGLGLCHGDLHGNNLMQGERLVLVDWEDLRLAPPEADLFMFAGEPYWEDFLAVYQAARPDFRLNPPLLYFYRLRRRVEDIYYFASRLFEERPDAATEAVIRNRLAEQYRDTRALLLEDPWNA